MALAGGTTPNAVYPLLRSQPRVGRVDWSRVEFFWGDERAVPPDDPESNFGTAYRMFISQLPNVRPEAIHRMQGEAADLDAAALTYETELRLAFGVRGERPPEFDLIWLGLGPDGHIASMFPDQRSLSEDSRLVVGVEEAGLEPYVPRVTFTFPALALGKRVVVLVAGEEKADAVAAAFGESAKPDPHVPSSLLASVASDLVVLLDSAAASGL